MVDVAPPNEPTYWDARYANGGNSGAGSYGEAMLRKVEWLSRLPGIKSIVEIGCGDFNFGWHLTGRLQHASYLGIDISEFVVQRNRFSYGSQRIRFEVAGQGIPANADLLLCVDVLFHIMDPDEQSHMLWNLAMGWKKYLAMSAYEYDGLKSAHVNIRRFDPAFFGKPILREVIEDDGEMYFYIFEKP